MLPQLGGYLCHGSKVNLARAETFIQVGGWVGRTALLAAWCACGVC